MKNLLLLLVLPLACFSSQAKECLVAPTSAIEDTSEIKALRKEQQDLVAQVRQELAHEEAKRGISKRDRKYLLDLRNLLVEMEANIAREATTKHINRRTAFDPYCSYYQRFSKYLEGIGTDNFPKANGQPIYGKVLIEVTIRRDGSVESVNASEATSKLIEEHAIKLVKSLAPFEPIPESAKEKYFELGASFNYVHEAGERTSRLLTPSDLSGKWQRGLINKYRDIPAGAAFQKGLTATIFTFNPDGSLLVELPCQEERFIKKIGGKLEILGTWSLSKYGDLTTTVVFHGTTRSDSGKAVLEGEEILVTPKSGDPWHLGKFFNDTQAKCTYAE